jgi:membrane-associated phospholipid phosphatase
MAQSSPAYRLKTSHELAWLGGSVAGLGLDHFVLKPRNKPFTLEQIAALRRADIPGVDRFATRFYGARARKASDYLLFGAPVAASALLLAPRIRGHFATEGTILLESMLFSASLVSITKDLVRRPRPLCYNPDVPGYLQMQTDARQSFYSGHTSVTTAACVAAAVMWSQYHPNSRWKPAVWVAAAAIPISTGILRIRGGKHYPTDVLTGLLLGTAAGVAIPYWHRR